ncbi:MAG: ABC-three component system protein [Candidatus Competibacter sp.]
MIYRIFSSLPTFKELEFHEGLNILLAQKESGASNKQTRNRAGKTSVIEIIHFLTGAKAEKESFFCSELIDQSFGLTFDLGQEKVTVQRLGKNKSKVKVQGAKPPNEKTQLSNTEWIDVLGAKMFGLHQLSVNEGRKPTFRSLFAYFVRRQISGAFFTPEKQATMQQPGDFQVALLYLFGLDWQIASEWQKVRDRERTLNELKKATHAGAFDNLIGTASSLRTQVTVAEARLKEMQTQLANFRVLPRYAEMEVEANQLTRQINDLANANVIDRATARDLETALRSEAPPPLDELENLYADAGISLPKLAIRRYDEVRSFHESIIRNRHDYLAEELDAAKQRIVKREQEKQRRDERRTEVMDILKTHGALEQFSKLQAETVRKEAEVESLRQRFNAAEQLEGAKNELDIERNRLTLRLRRDFAEQKALLSEAILAFEETSKRLYESAGSMTVEETSNGPKFQFPMQGSRSKGIKNMQIFCFDMMLIQLCAKRGIGPGFLVHDSHLFDGVDGRQILSALKVGADMAKEFGFQYVVTLNEDDAFKEATDDFNVSDYILPVVLTDAKEDGGLFGFRF